MRILFIFAFIPNSILECLFALLSVFILLTYNLSCKQFKTLQKAFKRLVRGFRGLDIDRRSWRGQREEKIQNLLENFQKSFLFFALLLYLLLCSAILLLFYIVFYTMSCLYLYLLVIVLYVLLYCVYMCFILLCFVVCIMLYYFICYIVFVLFYLLFSAKKHKKNFCKKHDRNYYILHLFQSLSASCIQFQNIIYPYALEVALLLNFKPFYTLSLTHRKNTLYNYILWGVFSTQKAYFLRSSKSNT